MTIGRLIINNRLLENEIDLEEIMKQILSGTSEDWLANKYGFASHNKDGKLGKILTDELHKEFVAGAKTALGHARADDISIKAPTGFCTHKRCNTSTRIDCHVRSPGGRDEAFLTMIFEVSLVPEIWLEISIMEEGVGSKKVAHTFDGGMGSYDDWVDNNGGTFEDYFAWVVYDLIIDYKRMMGWKNTS